jgi:hypothetical protein
MNPAGQPVEHGVRNRQLQQQDGEHQLHRQAGRGDLEMIAKGNRRPVFRQGMGEHRKDDQSEPGLQRHVTRPPAL